MLHNMLHFGVLELSKNENKNNNRLRAQKLKTRLRYWYMSKKMNEKYHLHRIL